MRRRPATAKELQKGANKFLDRHELKECLRQLDEMEHRIALAMEFIALTRLRRIKITGKHITTHIFRHTHISMLAEMAVPLKAIMQRVGHNDPNTTLSIYTHVTDTMTQEANKKIDALTV